MLKKFLVLFIACGGLLFGVVSQAQIRVNPQIASVVKAKASANVAVAAVTSLASSISNELKPLLESMVSEMCVSIKDSNMDFGQTVSEVSAELGNYLRSESIDEKTINSVVQMFQELASRGCNK